MLIDWKSTAIIVGAAGGAVYLGGARLRDGLSRFADALSFRDAELGPAVTLTERSELSQQDYIERGYLELTPGGRTQITPAGEEYIRQAKAGYYW